jgi:group I intron endonuclease
MWRNLINGKCYIGSSVNLYNRLSLYYSKLFMENYLKNSKSYIYNALLKHGHENLSLTILEYCDKEKCIEREDFFLSSFPHEYNILAKAGSSLGRKHYDETNKQKCRILIRKSIILVVLRQEKRILCMVNQE